MHVQKMMLTIAHAMQRFYLVSSSLAVGVGSLLPVLLLLLHFGRLSLDFAGTREGTVHFAAEKTGSHLDGRQLAQATGGEGFLLDEWGSVEVEDLVLHLIDAFQLADMISQGL